MTPLTFFYVIPVCLNDFQAISMAWPLPDKESDIAKILYFYRFSWTQPSCWSDKQRKVSLVQEMTHDARDVTSGLLIDSRVSTLLGTLAFQKNHLLNLSENEAGIFMFQVH